MNRTAPGPASESEPNEDPLRLVAGAGLVLGVFFAGILAFMVLSTSVNDVETLRKLAWVVLILTVSAFGLLLFGGAGMFSLARGDVEEAQPEPRAKPAVATASLPAAAAARESAPGAADEGASQITCQNCGAVSAAGSKFCHECGRPLAAEQ